MREYGEGSVMVLPFPLEMQFYGMADMLVKLLSLIGAHPGIRGARRLRILPKEDGSIIALEPASYGGAETVGRYSRGRRQRRWILNPFLPDHSLKYRSGALIVLRGDNKKLWKHYSGPM